MTGCAGAPDALATCINKYTDHEAHIWYSHHGKGGDLPPYYEQRTDFIHFHNMYKNTVKPSVIQYHSEPYLAWCEEECAGLSLFPPKQCKKLVVAQYHAGLEVYKDCTPVRNIIDFEAREYGPKIVKDRIRIGYSPSLSDASGFGCWHYKGVKATKTVLVLLQKQFPGLEVDVITGVSGEECIRRKRECNIIIDECVTPSYHKSGLEGLALGKLTISWVDDKVKKILKKASGSNINPFHGTHVGWLEDELAKICAKGIDYILEEGRKGRQWMEKYWAPSDIVQES